MQARRSEGRQSAKAVQEQPKCVLGMRGQADTGSDLPMMSSLVAIVCNGYCLNFSFAAAIR